MIDEYIAQIRLFSRIRPRTVLEIGAFDGEYSRTLQQAFGLAEQDLYLVEPNPDLQTRLQRDFPHANRIAAAITAEQRRVRFNRVTWPTREGMPSSSVLERVDAWSRQLRYEPVDVDAITGKSLLSKVNRPVDLCIVDVEGLAYDVLTSFESDLQNIRSLMIECEHEMIFQGQKLFDDVSALLLKNGFRQMAFRYSYSNQSDSIWIQERYVDLTFKPCAASA